MTVDEFIVNPDVLRVAYGHMPKLEGCIRFRSLNLNWRGPTLIIRADLPRFPDPAPQDWVISGFDTVQCHLRFLAVRNLAIHSWEPPAFGCLKATPRTEERSLHIDINGDGMNLAFDCSDSVAIGHVSAFRVDADGSDQGSRSFAGRIDSRRYNSLPEVWEKSYFERI
ncbi:Imm50 family immunity protein [Streptomyces sp. NPDC001450]